MDTLQDGVNNLVAGQVGKGGLLQPVGDMASKEGVNRAERGGKDDKGGYLPGPAQAGDGLADGAKKGGSGIVEGAKGAGGYISGFTKGWGGQKKEEAPQ